MKKWFITFILLFTSSLSFSQVYKWRSTNFSSRHNSSSYDWTEWTPWQPSSVLIVAQEQRVKVYSSTPQNYDMIENVVKSYDNDSNPIYSVMCVDENGSRCTMIWYHNSSEGSFVIFKFSNLELMYKVVSLD